MASQRAIMQTQMLRGSIARGRGLGTRVTYSRGATATGQIAYRAVYRAASSAHLTRCHMAHGAWHLSMDMVTEPFNAALKELLDKALPAQAAATLQAIALRLLAKIVFKTPVDTGLARATWLVARKRIEETKIPGAGKFARALSMGRVSLPGIQGSGTGKGSMQVAAEAGRAVQTTINLDPKPGSKLGIELRNNLAYILPLEYGWSGQAPLGMVRLSVAEMQGLGAKELAVMFRASWLENMKRAGGELRAYAKRFPVSRGARAGRPGAIRQSGMVVKF